MRIQWSSGAAQEMLGRLERVNQSVNDCRRQSEAVRSAMAEANPDGGNKAMKAAEERFGQLVGSLRSFEEALKAYQSAVRRADSLFEDAETEIGRLAAGLDSAQGAPVNLESGERYVSWEPAAYAVMPDMRVGVAPVPEWLRAAAADAVPYME